MIKEFEFIFCPKCGSRFEKKPPNLLMCIKCNLHYYVNPKPTTSILLLNSKNEILFVVRKFDPKKGMLDLPGGFVDIGETLEECMVREIKEELCINVTVNEITYIGSSVDEYEHGGVNSRTINAMYHAKLPQNAHITPTDDVADFLFIAPQDIPYDRMAFQGMKDFLKEYYL